MSQTNIAVIQLAQLGFADRIAQEAQGQPEIARLTAEHAAAEALKKQKDTVAETEQSGASRMVKAKKDGGGADSRRRERRQREPDSEQREWEDDSSPSPWAGNIVNMKV